MIVTPTDIRRAAAHGPSLLVLWLAAACATTSADRTAPAAPPTPAAATEPALDAKWAARLAELDDILEQKRAEAGVPGMALAIVQGDRVIHARGYGYRDVARGLPVTARTQFAIGSSTKAFTGLAVLLATERGSVALTDSPRKCLPYFRLADAETDAKITVRDLLIHSSGLSRTDVAWTSAAELSPEEVIRIAGKAKAAAGLGEKFNYQNVMYAAAGECAAATLGKSYRDTIEDEIFAPLGMDASNLTIAEMQAVADHALGYDLSQGSDGKVEGVTQTEMMSIASVAPAGAINSNVLDMARWLRFVLAKGELDGTRLVSARSFAEFVTPRMEISSTSGYALGWFVDEWKDKKRVHHGGNVPGFSAMVSMLPDDDLGFVLLSNASNVPLRDVVGKAVFSLALDDAGAAEVLDELRGNPQGADGPAVDPKLAVGAYEAKGVTVRVRLDGDALRLSVPGQPEYTLSHVGGRKYRFEPPAPAGFWATFRAKDGNDGVGELYLEQPHGNFALARVDVDGAAPEDAEPGALPPELAPMKELLGIYESADRNDEAEILVRGKKVLLDPPLYPPSALVAQGEDRYTLADRPGSVTIEIRRDAKGEVAGFLAKMMTREIRFDRAAAAKPIRISPARLMAKVARAHGAKRLARLESLEIRSRATFLHEGVEGEVVERRQAPGRRSETLTLKAFGRSIATIRELFDGEHGSTESSSRPAQRLRGKALDDARLSAAFNPLLDHERLFERITIKRRTTLDGEPVYVVEKTPKQGSTVVDWVSAKTFRVLRRDRQQSIGGGSMTFRTTQRYHDYRRVDGVLIPHRTVQTTALGPQETIVEVVSVRTGVDFDDAEFRAAEEPATELLELARVRAPVPMGD